MLQTMVFQAYVRTVNLALDKRLNYSYRNGSESTNRYIANSSVSVHNQSFACEGDERSLSDCRTSTLDNCSDSSVVSVRCQGEVFSNDTCKSAFTIKVTICRHPYHHNDHNHHWDTSPSPLFCLPSFWSLPSFPFFFQGVTANAEIKVISAENPQLQEVRINCSFTCLALQHF